MEDLKPKYLPLELVLNIVTCALPKPDVILAPSHPITQLLLSFTLVCKETRRLANQYLRQHCAYLSSEASLSALLFIIPSRPDLRSITKLYLAPFDNTIDNQPTATWVRELLCYTCATLKHLIVDIPFCSLIPEDDHLGVRNILREGFSRLKNLETLVSVRDELFLDVAVPRTEEAFWTRFKKLRRLAVYNATVDESLWRNAAKLPHLETLVLTRADDIRRSNFKMEYFRYCRRALKVLLIDVDERQVRYGSVRRANWDTIDPKKLITIMTYSIPMFMDDNPTAVCQDYVRIGAEYDTLWDWEGEVIRHPPKFVQQVSSGG